MIRDAARNVRNILDLRSNRAISRRTCCCCDYMITTAKMYEDCVLQSMRFPQKLWRIVNECKNNAIQWSPNGDTILLDYKRFQTEYLDARRPIFKTTNITSFIRQLNLYGFRKVTYTHTRDPIYGFHNPHVHEFLHDSFRANRADLLSKVCRKANPGRGKCFQHDNVIKSAEDSPRSESNCVSRLKMCQLALTKTLEQIAQEFRREQEEKLTIVKNNKRISSQDTGSQQIELKSVSNCYPRDPSIAKNVKYSTFLPLTDASFECKTISSWCIATMDK